MTGTSSDVAFADAYVKGVRGLRRHATPTRPRCKQRHGGAAGRPVRLQRRPQGPEIASIFLGYTPNEVGEGVSWALEGYINDFGIANMAGALARPGAPAPSARRYREERRVLPQPRAATTCTCSTARVGFFQGKSADGEWKSRRRTSSTRACGARR